jgi:tetratricopeptide (TPR) repeat protein
MASDLKQPVKADFLWNQDDQRRILLMALFLVAVTFVLFAPAIRFQFLNYDDDLYVYENPHVLGGLTLSGLAYAFTTIYSGNWMPLTRLSFQLDATLSGRWPAGFHFIAIIVAWGMGDIAEKFSRARRPVVAAAIAICLLAGAANRATLFRWSDSVTLLTDSIRKGPHASACNNLASALDDRGDYAAAIPYCDMAINLQPKSPGAYITRGRSFQGLENYDGAIADYTTAIELDKTLAKAWNNRGNAYIGKGDLDTALANFTRAVELKPDLAEAWNNRAFVWCSKSNYTAAIADCTRAIEINPGNSRAYNNRGNIFSGMADWQHAVEDYSHAIELDPFFATAYNNRAKAFLASKAYDKARADIEACTKLGGQPNADTVRVLSENAGHK